MCVWRLLPAPPQITAVTPSYIATPDDCVCVCVYTCVCVCVCLPVNSVLTGVADLHLNTATPVNVMMIDFNHSFSTIRPRVFITVRGDEECFLHTVNTPFILTALLCAHDAFKDLLFYAGTG